MQRFPSGVTRFQPDQFPATAANGPALIDRQTRTALARWLRACAKLKPTVEIDRRTALQIAETLER